MVKFSMEKENRGKNMAIPKYQYIKDKLKNKIIRSITMFLAVISLIIAGIFMIVVLGGSSHA